MIPSRGTSSTMMLRGPSECRAIMVIRRLAAQIHTGQPAAQQSSFRASLQAIWATWLSSSPNTRTLGCSGLNQRALSVEGNGSLLPLS